ncbi:5'-3' exonuclease H3TH domain-containing protein [Streptomyces sp. NPDC088752]|uniref:5'-3' exonuclease n=1 Tax=Streptomyces sp. NPDC088752 TaxID=3154963 RepID=UPI003445EDF6
MTRPILLVDGNNLLIRAVEATRRVAMNAPDGTDTSALVSFTATLSRHTRQIRPYKVLVLWDSSSALVPSWRKTIYPEYKANRPSAPDEYRRASREMVTAFLQHARVPQLGILGEEADDLIGAYWRTLDMPMTILSSDKDLLQLVGRTKRGAQCEQIRLSSADTATDHWTADRVEEYYGCAPEHLPLVLALAGDASDNIPGVPGIGPKFAVKHLSAADWKLDDVTHARIQAHRPQIALYRRLTDLREPRHSLDDNLPSLPPFMPTTPGPDSAWRALHAFLSGYGMTKTISRLIRNELW